MISCDTFCRQITVEDMSKKHKWISGYSMELLMGTHGLVNGGIDSAMVALV